MLICKNDLKCCSSVTKVRRQTITKRTDIRIQKLTFANVCSNKGAVKVGRVEAARIVWNTGGGDSPEQSAQLMLAQILQWLHAGSDSNAVLL